MNKAHHIALALTLLATTGCASKLERIRTKLINTQAKNFTLESIDGDEISLSDFKGKPVLLNFFAVG